MARNLSAHRANAEATAKAQRDIQRKMERVKPEKAKKGAASAAQLGQRNYPRKLPPQHIKKPGLEHELELKPMFEAPAYQGSEKLAGLAALITGGDSGIGRAVAVLFAREGADITIVYLNEHKDAEATQRAVEAEGRQCLMLAGDVRDPAFCQAAVDAAIEAYGRLDILVNNAAFQQHAERLEDLSLDHFDMTLKTNLYGYFNMAKAAVPAMKDGGSIVMTGSITGIDGSKNLLDYSMTKGGIHAFTRALSSQLVDRRIRVNCVAPGPVWTPLNPADKTAEDVQSFGQDTTMKRVAQPEEIAPAFVFFASPCCSSYITGEILPIIGGY